MSSSTIARGLLEKANTLLQKASFLGPLLARITVGYVFIESGWGKVHNLEGVTSFFTELGIPAPAFQATFVSYLELIGGVLVLLGLFARVAAFPLIGTMIVALITARAEDVASFSDLTGTIEFLYAVMLAWIAVAGPGPVSLDRFVSRLAPFKSFRSMARAAGLEPV